MRQVGQSFAERCAQSFVLLQHLTVRNQHDGLPSLFGQVVRLLGDYHMR